VVVCFGSFTLDEGARTLQRGARSLHLSPKAFDLLILLVRRRPEAIAKADIHQHLWPDTFVSDGNVAVLVAEIRRAIGDSARDARFVRTVQRFGYAFIGSVQGGPSRRGGSARQAASCWLAWGNRRATLAIGENVVGRDPAADIFIDAVGVSRRHALIIVGAEQVTLADLSSKNGTFANGVRVTDPIALKEGTEIRLGPVPVRFCGPPAGASTQTWDASRTGSLP
jgi:DNA-binding winged helix-turn-helix (wHTH) protein